MLDVGGGGCEKVGGSMHCRGSGQTRDQNRNSGAGSKRADGKVGADFQVVSRVIVCIIFIGAGRVPSQQRSFRVSHPDTKALVQQWHSCISNGNMHKGD